MLISFATFGLLVYFGVPVTIVYEKYIQLATTAICFSFLLSLYLYMKSLTVSDEELATGGNSGEIYCLLISIILNMFVLLCLTCVNTKL